MIVQLIMAFTSTMGFGLLFGLKFKHLLLGSFGGFISWFTYLALMQVQNDEFIGYLAAAAAGALYGELVARIAKAPATVFYIPAIVPLVPGGSLYRTMAAIVQKNARLTRVYGMATAKYAFAIAAGVSIVWATFAIVGNIVKNAKKKKKA